ncbi:uncharacterized protein METZ01_LOCUS371769, partial [marine metagenome]
RRQKVALVHSLRRGMNHSCRSHSDREASPVI